MARSFLYHILAQAFADPTQEVWDWLASAPTREACRSVLLALADEGSALVQSARAWLDRLPRAELESVQAAYVAAFGHAARGDCPLNEIEYGDLKADPLFQPHRLADLAAFYRAFDLEVAEEAAERPDHIGMELEFMSVLAAKAAYALEHQADADASAPIHEAQKKFLREHLGRWSPAFTRRLARATGNEILGSLAIFAREFIAADCVRFGVRPGSEDLLLRPVDESAESICSSCGLANLPPGATAPETPA
jgi:DMSO reductase family type II enzyme chaperone